MAFEPTDGKGFIDLWDLIFPASFTRPIADESDGEGQDVPAFMSQIWSAVDSSFNSCQQSYYLKAHSAQTGALSDGPTKATGTLEVRRTAPLYTPITIPVGTAIQATSTDPGLIEAPIAKFVTTETLVINIIGPSSLPIEAVLPGTAWNLEGPPVIPGFGKGFPDNPAPPFPGSPYTPVESPTPWYRWKFLEGGEEEPTPTTISNSGTEISGSFISTDIGKNIFVFPTTPLAVDIPHAITGVTNPGGAAIIEPPMPLDEEATWRPATFAELNITLIQDFAPAGNTTGGSGGTLEAIGSDRRIGRALSQDDEDYRTQICNYPEIITPNAIIDITTSILDPKGIPFEFKEVLPPGLDVNRKGFITGFIWDIHPYDFGEIGTIVKPVGSEYVGQGGVYLPVAPRLFIICVEFVSLEAAFGLSYDDGPFPNAWDANSYDGNFGLVDSIFLQCIQQLWKALNEAKAAGVRFLIVINNAP